MDEPLASRPYMPGYGIAGPDAGMGLLPWSWAKERLVSARNYWVATVRPDGWPHAMPVSEFITRTNAKYETDYSVDFLDPSVNATVRVRPRWAFALTQSDFEGSPTRWKFGE